MIKKTTIEKAVQSIAQLRQAAMDACNMSEDAFGFVTSKVESQADKMQAKADKLQEKIVARLRAEGLCSDEVGLTDDDANRPIFAGIDNLFEIGNGDWC